MAGASITEDVVLTNALAGVVRSACGSQCDNRDQSSAQQDISQHNSAQAETCEVSTREGPEAQVVDRVICPSVCPLARRVQRPYPDSLFEFRALVAPALVYRNWAYGLVKRSMDLLGAAVLLVVCAPLMLIVGTITRLTDGGPMLFVQTRVGRNGRLFRCYKFRTMDVNAEQKQAAVLALNHHDDPRTFKAANDPRVTRFGRIVRKTSLDELPQLWNVVRGEMSLVGPRPPLPAEVSLYSPREQHRLDVQPGLTCIWQVSGRGDVAFDQQVEMDLEYINRRSLWLDVKLLLLTIPAVLFCKGAY